MWPIIREFFNPRVTILGKIYFFVLFSFHQNHFFFFFISVSPSCSPSRLRKDRNRSFTTNDSPPPILRLRSRLLLFSVTEEAWKPTDKWCFSFSSSQAKPKQFGSVFALDVIYWFCINTESISLVSSSSFQGKKKRNFFC